MATYLDQDLLLDNLAISTDGGLTATPIEFVQFDGVQAQDVALEAKLDVWVLPFMNVYAIAGLIDGQGEVPFGIQVDGLLDLIGIGICNIPRPPAFCNDVIALEAKPDYKGYNYGLGTVFAGGWKSFFLALPLTWVHSELDITNSTIDTFEAEILFGRIFKLSKGSAVEAFIGGSYLDAAYTGTGSVVLPLSELDPSFEDTTIDYRIDEKNKDKWNLILGAEYQIGEAWDLQGQVGLLGSRTQLTVSGVFRW